MNEFHPIDEEWHTLQDAVDSLLPFHVFQFHNLPTDQEKEKTLAKMTQDASNITAEAYRALTRFRGLRDRDRAIHGDCSVLERLDIERMLIEADYEAFR